MATLVRMLAALEPNKLDELEAHALTQDQTQRANNMIVEAIAVIRMNRGGQWPQHAR